ncbi:MAG: site-specific DNA-methyltransferase [Christensenellaceae bacterium]|jgi:adenine-specific DNA-methyltransferase|nr:site-specific DNA-methyltransferase [Christensenellaceae bacterium]
MAILDELVTQIENPDLRARIAAEVEKLAKQKKFGLVFEEHLPECTPLWDIPVKAGRKAALKTGHVNDFYTVLKIEDGVATCLNKDKSATAEFPVEELVCVAEFGEPIYPYLKPIDTVCNAPDSDLWHTLIEADNYHALQLLEYLYAGKVDCIYIDPPYNTGARDWKYNNDYVDNNDQYRHSKWLSMMQKRLKIAKKLLNPNDSVLIVTIDEKEYLHLGCLLEEMFPEANMQMISSVINPYGTQRLNEFSRNDEYIFFLMFGRSQPAGIVNEDAPEQSYWKTFRRGDLASRRGQPKGGKAQFYPIYVDDLTRKIVSIGDPIAHEVDRHTVQGMPGCTTVFPLRDDGTEMNWCVRPEAARTLLEKGYIKAGTANYKTQQIYPILYLRSGTIDDIDSGKLVIDGYADDNSIIAHYVQQKEQMPQTNWHFKEHSARDYGSNLIRDIFKDKRFTFPKSLYAVKDCLFLFVKNKPNALIVDFFAGSGTTMHAVNLLNAEDGGHRRCIMVTNNEVSDAEAKEMSRRGLKPGDEEWEKLGIARYVTWPRTVCSIEGHDVNGNPLKGNYIGSDIPMADGFKANAAFFKLGFLDKNAVALGRQFKEMLPTLWMKAGAHGACPALGETVPEMLILPENRMAVLVDERAYIAFSEKLDEHPEIETVFLVTDSDSGYRDMISGLDVKESYQLYRDYLDNFRINAVRR